jgi:hypothetical protein
MDSINAAGGNAFFISLCGAAQDGGCNHPGVVGQAQMAAMAAPIIAAKLGWEVPTHA